MFTGDLPQRLGATRLLLRWFVPGPAAVLVQRTRANPATESAAKAAVGSARVPAGVIGYPRSYTGVPETASGTTVTHGFPNLGAGFVPAVITESRTGTQVDAITVVAAHRPR